jgi:hypothetical protein
MKIFNCLYFVTVFLLIQNLNAFKLGLDPEDNIKFTCVTSTPTTTFEAFSDEKYVYLSLIHHMGTDVIPIHSGIITIKDLSNLKEKALVLSKLGSNIDVKFNKEDCISYGDRLYSCYGRDKTKIGSIEVNGFDFNTSLGTIAISNNFYNFVTINFSISYNNNTYTIPMDYYNFEFEKECSFD